MTCRPGRRGFSDSFGSLASGFATAVPHTRLQVLVWEVEIQQCSQLQYLELDFERHFEIVLAEIRIVDHPIHHQLFVAMAGWRASSRENRHTALMHRIYYCLAVNVSLRVGIGKNQEI